LNINPVALSCARMPSITLKDIPDDLHAQLKAEADAHFRSMDQEAMARIQRSFDLDERMSTETVNRLIDQAVASGPEEPLTRAKFDAARDKARRQLAGRSKAA
jgi:plasmid stability protein